MAQKDKWMSRSEENSFQAEKVNVEASRPGSQNRKVDLRHKKNGVWAYI